VIIASQAIRRIVSGANGAPPIVVPAPGAGPQVFKVDVTNTATLVVAGVAHRGHRLTQTHDPRVTAGYRRNTCTARRSSVWSITTVNGTFGPVVRGEISQVPRRLR
jgi:hypothetical protein